MNLGLFGDVAFGGRGEVNLFDRVELQLGGQAELTDGFAGGGSQDGY